MVFGICQMTQVPGTIPQLRTSPLVMANNGKPLTRPPESGAAASERQVALILTGSHEAVRAAVLELLCLQQERGLRIEQPDGPLKAA